MNHRHYEIIDRMKDLFHAIGLGIISHESDHDCSIQTEIDTLPILLDGDVILGREGICCF